MRETWDSTFIRAGSTHALGFLQLRARLQRFGIAYNEAIDFNQRNTTVSLGAAHNFDEVSGTYQPEFASKGTTDFLLGVTQLLGPLHHLHLQSHAGLQ